MKHIMRGDEIQVNGDWYPVIGFSLVHRPDGSTTGSVFTLKPIGKYEPWLGYRVDCAAIQAVRPGRAALEQEGK